MEMINLKDLMNDVYDDAMCETLTTVDSLCEASSDVLLDMLAEEGATMTELVMAKYIMNRYVDVLRDLIDDAFEIEEYECDEDCENCPLAEKE